MTYTSKYITAHDEVTMMAEANLPQHVRPSVSLYVHNPLGAHTFMTAAAARRLAIQLLVAAEAVEASEEDATLSDTRTLTFDECEALGLDGTGHTTGGREWVVTAR